MSTTELLSEMLWARLRSEAAGSRSRRFAVAYVTDARVLRMTRGDTLVVDASDEAVAFGKTSAAAIEELFEQGIAVFSLPCLHAKIYVFDSCAIVGSPNLSRNSQATLHEAALLSSEHSLVSQAAAQVSTFVSRAEVVDAAFVDRIKSIEVTRSTPASPQPAATSTEPVVGLWRLAKPPKGGALLRAYFVALMQIQLGQIRPDASFRLWDGHFKTHLDSGRLRQMAGSFVLSPSGVAYFTTGSSAPKPDLVECFRRALQTGRESDLPDGLETTTLVPMP